MDSPELSASADSLLQHAAWVRALAAELVREPGAADELAQETWLAFLRARPDTERPLRPWLARVLRNAAALRARQRAGRRAREEEVARPEAVPSSHELVERAEEQQRLARAVLALDEPYRGLLLLRYYEGLTPARMAVARGMPAATVRTQLARGLERLRRRLDDEHGGDRRAWIAVLRPLLPRAAPSAALGPIAVMALGAATLATLVVSVSLLERRGESGAGAVLEAPASTSAASRANAEARTSTRAAIEPAGARVAALETRSVRLLDAGGRALAAYVVSCGERELSSDEAGWIELPAGARELVPIDDPRLARDEPAGHGRRRARVLDRAPLALPASDSLIVPAGPELSLEIVSAGIDPARLRARLVASDERDVAASAQPLAPVRTRGRARAGPWVRFAEQPAGAHGATLRLELSDEAGLWRGTTSLAALPEGEPPLVRVELVSTGVVEGRVEGPSAEQVAASHVSLHAAGRDDEVVAWTTPDELGRYSLPWIAPGDYVLRVRSALHSPRSRALHVEGGERRAIDLRLDVKPAAGPVSGVVESASNAYEGQLLVFLLDEHEEVLEVFPTTWSADEAGRHVAPFRFESAPAGKLRLDVVSLADAVTFHALPSSFEAPCAGIRVTLDDERAAADFGFEVVDAASGRALESYEVEVRIDGGLPRRFRCERSEGGAAWSFTLHAGGLRWNRFEASAPLRSLADGARIEWKVRADGYAPLAGDESDFDLIAPTRRAANVRLQ